MSRILIVDDHDIVRNGMAQLVAQEKDLEVCGQAGSVREALTRVEELSPDLVIIDISLKDGSGLELIKSLRAVYAELRLLVLSMHDASLYAERALRAGAHGYVMKEEPSETIIKAIRVVLKGEIYLSEHTASKLLGSLFSRGASPAGGVQSLTDRELEIFELLGAGRSTKEMADCLGISTKTIEAHRCNIKRKLDLSTNTELVRHAVWWNEMRRNPPD